MRKAFSTIIIILALVAVLSFAAYCWAIYSMGKNFVHEPLPEVHSNEAPAKSMPNRATFPTTYSKLGLDTTLGKYLSQHPLYRLPDTVNLPAPVECGCDCGDFDQKIYFDAKPREIYVVTYSVGETTAGVIDVVFTFKNAQWTCSKSSYLDSTEKARIINRLEREVLSKMR